MRTFNWRPRKQKDRRGGATFCDKPSRRESESESEAVEKNDEEKKEKKRENEWPGLGPARGWRWWSGLVLKRDARGGGLVWIYLEDAVLGHLQGARPRSWRYLQVAGVTVLAAEKLRTRAHQPCGEQGSIVGPIIGTYCIWDEWLAEESTPCADEHFDQVKV